LVESQPAARSSSGVRALVVELLVFFALLGGIDTSVRRFAERRFIPFATLRSAVQQGDKCFVVTGGSDMQSAMKTSALEAALVPRAAPCVANLAIGGTLKDARFMAFRRYLSEGRTPAALLVGFKGYDVADEVPETPGYYVGSNAAVYAWGALADLKTYYPEWSFTAADNSFRFLLYRVTALGAYRQALWERVNALEERAGLRAPNLMNSFGYVKEFVALDETKRRVALTRQRHGAQQWALARFNAELIHAAERAGVAAVHFVRLPALSATERAYFADAESKRSFDEFMQRTAASHHGRYIDLSHASWFEDSLLLDGLHYAPRGGALITEAVIEALRDPAP
jgi:hypothetical protein